MKGEAERAALEAMEAGAAMDALAGVRRVRPVDYLHGVGAAVGAPMGGLIAKALGLKGAAARALCERVANTGVQILAREGLRQMGLARASLEADMLVCTTCGGAMKGAGEAHRCVKLPGVPLGKLLP